MQQLLELLSSNLEYVIPVLVFGLEWLLRKIPGAKPVLKLLDGALDKLPGFEDKK